MTPIKLTTLMSSSRDYPTRQLGRNGPRVSAIGYGAMGLGSVFYGDANDEESYKALTYAADRGTTFWDTSDRYGHSEQLIGNWFTKTGRRSEIFIATKFACAGTKINNKPSYIRQQIEKSLTNLQTDYIDLYYVHRIDPEVPIEITTVTLGELVNAGKIRWIGLSEASVDTLKRAKAVTGAGEKLVAAQMEYSLMEFGIEHSGFLKTARELGVSILAYSPLCRGMLTGSYRSREDFGASDVRLTLPRWSLENFPKNLILVDKVKAIAQKFDATPGEVALAWILAEHSDMISIPGTKSVERLEENARAIYLQLSLEDVKELRKLATAADAVVGERYLPHHLLTAEGNTIPLSEWKGESDNQ